MSFPSRCVITSAAITASMACFLSGALAHPRYHVEVGRFLLNDSENTYESTYLPSKQLTLELSVTDGSEAQRTQLTSIHAHVMVSITDESGRTVCRAEGNLAQSNGVAEHKWVLATTGSEVYYWNSDCRDISLHRHKTYNFAVIISETRNQQPLREVTLTLVEGGIDLP